MVAWLMSFIAERVDHPVAAVRLAQSAEWGLGYLAFNSYDDDAAREVVRVIRDDLPAAVDAEWPSPADDVGNHVREMIEQATRWAKSEGLL